MRAEAESVLFDGEASSRIEVIMKQYGDTE